jgi:hypothetical protein
MQEPVVTSEEWAVIQTALLATLEQRFTHHMQRHPAQQWADVAAKLIAHPDKLRSLQQMEQSGGEPDVVTFADDMGDYVFVDCAAQSPTGRRSLCFDREGLESRKDHPPQNSALDVAAAMGISLLTEDQYRQLQQLGEFDTKTSSWLATPASIRKLGGALYGDRRYDQVFVYHNGAQSYYAVRGFRGVLRV